ncbi:hypothetical protein DIPPA_12339 [Diplonema papillatum]|nr:hypothetical protein DIPPA_12339 [Diplonema papillatum]
MEFQRPAGPQMDERVPVGNSVHPVQALCENHYAESERMRMGKMQELYGLALPLRRQAMEDLLASHRRLAPLESNFVALDVFRGDHADISWEDYLCNPENDERTRRPTHDLMEEQVFGRVQRPLHTKDII